MSHNKVWVHHVINRDSTGQCGNYLINVTIDYFILSISHIISLKLFLLFILILLIHFY